MYDRHFNFSDSGSTAMGRAFQSGIASYSHSAGDNAKALGGSNV